MATNTEKGSIQNRKMQKSGKPEQQYYSQNDFDHYTIFHSLYILTRWAKNCNHSDALIKLCVSTIPNVSVNKMLIQSIRAVNQSAIILGRAREMEDAKQLYELGATYVIMPHYLGASYATNMTSRIGLDAEGFAEERKKHLYHIRKNRQ